MVENTMPTAEAEIMAGAPDERQSYELAFHILPTVVEGEVPSVFDAIKKIVTNAGGEITDEESPERFDLAYEIVKHLEGKNRRFGSAYFGWVRFKADAESAPGIGREVEANTHVLRHLLVRLTRIEEANPFRFHDALESIKQVSEVRETEYVKKDEPVAEAEGEVDTAALDEALKKDEA